MIPGNYDMVMPKGSTFTRQMTYKIGNTPVNLTGYTARMQARPAVNSSTVVLDLTTGNGKITLGGSQGTITLSLTAAETAAIAQNSLVYDLELVSGGGEVYRIIEGSIAVTPEVTR